MPRAKAQVKNSKLKVESKASKVKVVAPKAVKAKTTAKKELPKETGLKISVYGISGRVLENITLPKEIFGQDINDSLMSQAVRVYLANQRIGTVKTKSRGEVNISTRKIYRQKGTGRARHGAASAPIFVGGGVAFGPRPRDFSLKLPKNARRKALFSALSFKLKNGEIKIISGLEKLTPKTKEMASVLSKLQLNGKNVSILFVTPEKNEKYQNAVKAAKNIEGVSLAHSTLLNTYAVLKAKEILFAKDSIDLMKKNFLTQ